jgi:hypothetical protein
MGKHETPYQKISGVVDRFTDVSSSEKELAMTIVGHLESSSYSLDDLLKTTLPYRITEGKAFIGLLKRLKSLVGADRVEISGVHTPLDVEVDSSGKKIKIFLPEDLDSYADSGIIHDLIRYASSTESVTLDRTGGDLISSDKEGDFFVMGYITEILSDQKIEKISYTKGASYQQGRMCARTKTLLSVLDQHKVPSKFLKIPERYLGGVSKFKEPEIIRALQSHFKNDKVDHLRRFLESLLEHSIRVDRARHEGKIGINVFLPTSEILHVFKRKTRRTLQKNRRGGSTTIVESIDPTKPSQLATVAPWEREIVSEMYEHSWDYQKKLIDDFEKIPAINRNYNDFGQQLSETVNKQWEAKQRVLRATKHRIEAYPGKRDELLFKKLNWVRESLSSFAILEGIPDKNWQEFSPYSILPSRVSVTGAFEPTPIDVLRKDGRMSTHFPHTDRLLSAWETMTKKREALYDASLLEDPERS